VYSPGAVTALHAAILAATLPGDKVIVQSPVYHPFFSAVTTTGRVLVENPLRFDQGRYTMDLDHLEQLAASGARHLILCSPHNPVGRVWQVSELAGVLDIARRYQMTIVSDELHADLVYPGIRHTPLARLATVDDRLITIVAPSKTFNIPGLGLSAMIVPDRDRRRALQGVFHQLHVQATNPFSIVAFEAAYRDGEPWLLSLLNYLTGTRDLVRAYLEEHLPEIKWVEPEGTYLLWLDCRALHMNDRALQDFMVKDAHVGLSPGIQFGQPGSGFMRMNIGAPRKTILQALAQIHTAWAARA
jgi:cystathionine beta-lyase